MFLRRLSHKPNPSFAITLEKKFTYAMVAFVTSFVTAHKTSQSSACFYLLLLLSDLCYQLGPQI